MRNALHMAQEFDAMLPAAERPEHTEGYEGFFHLSELSGDVVEAVARYIIRDHDAAKFAAKKELMEAAAAYLLHKIRPRRGRACAQGFLLQHEGKDPPPLPPHRNGEGRNGARGRRA